MNKDHVERLKQIAEGERIPAVTIMWQKIEELEARVRDLEEEIEHQRELRERE